MTAHPLVVVGIGHDGPAGLSAEARAHVAAARILAGGRRHLDFFPDWPGETIVIGGDLAAVVGRVREAYRREKTVVLASGDPLFYGIGRPLLEAFPREDLLFLPHRQLGAAGVRPYQGDMARRPRSSACTAGRWRR